MSLGMGFYENGNKPSDSIKDGEFVDQLRVYRHIKKDSARGVYYFFLVILFH
jgi:hypothetical protein